MSFCLNTCISFVNGSYSYIFSSSESESEPSSLLTSTYGS